MLRLRRRCLVPRKGDGVYIHKPGRGNCTVTREFGDAGGGGLGKRGLFFLMFLTLQPDCLEIGNQMVKHVAPPSPPRGARRVLNCPSPTKGRLIHTNARTRNRIRPPRLAASGPQNNVVEGRRQHRSVISGKNDWP